MLRKGNIPNKCCLAVFMRIHKNQEHYQSYQ